MVFCMYCSSCTNVHDKSSRTLGSTPAQCQGLDEHREITCIPIARKTQTCERTRVCSTLIANMCLLSCCLHGREADTGSSLAVSCNLSLI